MANNTPKLSSSTGTGAVKKTSNAKAIRSVSETSQQLGDARGGAESNLLQEGNSDLLNIRPGALTQEIEKIKNDKAEIASEDGSNVAQEFGSVQSANSTQQTAQRATTNFANSFWQRLGAVPDTYTGGSGIGAYGGLGKNSLLGALGTGGGRSGGGGSSGGGGGGSSGGGANKAASSGSSGGARPSASAASAGTQSRTGASSSSGGSGGRTQAFNRQVGPNSPGRSNSRGNGGSSNVQDFGNGNTRGFDSNNGGSVSNGTRGSGNGSTDSSNSKGALMAREQQVKNAPKADGVEDVKAKTDEEKEAIDRIMNMQNFRVFNADNIGVDNTSNDVNNNSPADEKSKKEVAALLADSFSGENMEKNLDALEKRGLDVYLSQHASFNDKGRPMGGWVAAGETGKIKMLLQRGLTDYNHTDVGRHEANHIKDNLDGKLDGLYFGESKDTQDLMIKALRQFEDGNISKKLDAVNLQYGAGYLKHLNDPAKNKWTFAEARAVLEQEYADKPEAFRESGGAFAELADHFEETGVKTYQDSVVKKDGHEDGTALA